jgi:hypothetical protein
MPSMSGTIGSPYAPGQATSGVDPTVGYMIAFVIGEMFVFHFLSKHLNMV